MAIGRQRVWLSLPLHAAGCSLSHEATWLGAVCSESPGGDGWAGGGTVSARPARPGGRAPHGEASPTAVILPLGCSSTCQRPPWCQGRTGAQTRRADLPMPTPHGPTDRTQGLSSQECRKERASGAFPANVRAFYRCISLLLPTRGKGVCHLDVSSLRLLERQESAGSTKRRWGGCAHTWRPEGALTWAPAPLCSSTETSGAPSSSSAMYWRGRPGGRSFLPTSPPRGV